MAIDTNQQVSIFGLIPPITDIQPHTQYSREQEDAESDCINQLFIKIFAGEMEQEKMNIRIGPVMITQCFSRFPVPVGAGTIAPAIPDTQYKPGKSSKQYGYQMQLSCFGKGPAHYIEQCKRCMKNKEEDIEELVPHIVISK